MPHPTHRHDEAHRGLVPIDQLASGTPTTGMVPTYSGTLAAIWAMGSGGGSDLDSILALSTGQDIADALTGAASPSASNVFATMADAGGGGGGSGNLDGGSPSSTYGGVAALDGGSP